MKNVILIVAFVFGMSGAFAAIDQTAVDKCKSCHEETVKNFLAGTHHGKAFTKTGDEKKYSCESCHGNGDKHIGDNSKASIISFGKKSAQKAEEQSKQCMGCHQKNPNLMMWTAGQHKKNDVSCSSCHSSHKSADVAKTPENCMSCHKDIKALVAKSSHHPIVEGKVSCSDCHNPHGSLSHGMLKADNTNQLCYKCHADKRGPFVWEHSPVEENCSTCHNPHGSNHNQLLTKRAPQLCHECHVQAHANRALDGSNGFGGAGTRQYLVAGKSCLGCHGRIHGSNGPGAKAFQR